MLRKSLYIHCQLVNSYEDIFGAKLLKWPCKRSCKLVDFFYLPQTQHNSYTFSNSPLQAHKSYSTNHKLRNSYAHIFATVTAVNVVQNAYTPASKNVKSQRNFANQIVNSSNESCTLVEYFLTYVLYIFLAQTQVHYICCDESQDLFFSFKWKVSRAPPFAPSSPRNVVQKWVVRL